MIIFLAGKASAESESRKTPGLCCVSGRKCSYHHCPLRLPAGKNRADRQGSALLIGFMLVYALLFFFRSVRTAPAVTTISPPISPYSAVPGPPVSGS